MPGLIESPGDFDIANPWIEDVDKRSSRIVLELWENYQAGEFPVAASPAHESRLQMIPESDLLVIEIRNEKTHRVEELQVTNFGAPNRVGNNFMSYTCRSHCLAFRGERRHLSTFLNFSYGFVTNDRVEQCWKTASEVKFPDEGLVRGLEYQDFRERVEIVEYAIWLKEPVDQGDPSAEESTVTILSVVENGQEVIAAPPADTQYDADVSFESEGNNTSAETNNSEEIINPPEPTITASNTVPPELVFTDPSRNVVPPEKPPVRTPESSSNIPTVEIQSPSVWSPLTDPRREDPAQNVAKAITQQILDEDQALKAPEPTQKKKASEPGSRTSERIQQQKNAQLDLTEAEKMTDLEAATMPRQQEERARQKTAHDEARQQQLHAEKDETQSIAAEEAEKQKFAAETAQQQKIAVEKAKGEKADVEKVIAEQQGEEDRLVSDKTIDEDPSEAEATQAQHDAAPVEEQNRTAHAASAEYMVLENIPADSVQVSASVGGVNLEDEVMTDGSLFGGSDGTLDHEDQAGRGSPVQTNGPMKRDFTAPVNTQHTTGESPSSDALARQEEQNQVDEEISGSQEDLSHANKPASHGQPRGADQPAVRTTPDLASAERSSSACAPSNCIGKKPEPDAPLICEQPIEGHQLAGKATHGTSGVQDHGSVHQGEDIGERRDTSVPVGRGQTAEGYRKVIQTAHDDSNVPQSYSTHLQGHAIGVGAHTEFPAVHQISTVSPMTNVEPQGLASPRSNVSAGGKDTQDPRPSMSKPGEAVATHGQASGVTHPISTTDDAHQLSERTSSAKPMLPPHGRQTFHFGAMSPTSPLRQELKSSSSMSLPQTLSASDGLAAQEHMFPYQETRHSHFRMSEDDFLNDYQYGTRAPEHSGLEPGNAFFEPARPAIDEAKANYNMSQGPNLYRGRTGASTVTEKKWTKSLVVTVKRKPPKGSPGNQNPVTEASEVQPTLQQQELAQESPCAGSAASPGQTNEQIGDVLRRQTGLTDQGPGSEANNQDVSLYAGRYSPHTVIENRNDTANSRPEYMMGNSASAACQQASEAVEHMSVVDNSKPSGMPPNHIAIDFEARGRQASLSSRKSFVSQLASEDDTDPLAQSDGDNDTAVGQPAAHNSAYDSDASLAAQLARERYPVRKRTATQEGGTPPPAKKTTVKMTYGSMTRGKPPPRSVPPRTAASLLSQAVTATPKALPKKPFDERTFRKGSRTTPRKTSKPDYTGERRIV